MYTIGQVSEMFSLPVSTLRYYDREGLLPGMERQSGIRKFGEQQLEALRVIECLKASGLEIREIRQFMAWCAERPSTYPQRRQLFETRKAAVEEEMRRLEKTLAMVRFKCWYYDTAIKEGGEDGTLAGIPETLPPEIRALYDRCHAAETEAAEGGAADSGAAEGGEENSAPAAPLSFIPAIPAKESVTRGEPLNVLGGAANDGPARTAEITVWGKADDDWKALLTASEEIAAGEHKHLYYTLTPEMIASASASGEVEELELLISDRKPGPGQTGKFVFIG
ncbi:MAG: MerR family transcriptional regulator [Lachnospiraceae bacterium]|nr:MerR family transcriptional regulator [Lachnospiraceae bacterium]